MDSADTPTIFHVTHWKAGSQWVRGLLRQAAEDRLVPGKDSPSWFFQDPIRLGGIYTPVYATREQFCQVVRDDYPHRVFVLIRDPRDTAVSWYYSLLYSHPKAYDTVAQARVALKKMSKAEGLQFVFENYVNHVVGIQRSWFDAGTRIFRYEDLLNDQVGVVRQILTHCDIQLTEQQIVRIVRRSSFRRRTWWRFGLENRRSHLRKGVAGDWKSHFDLATRDRFKSLYGDWLIQSGYENDQNW